MDKKCIGVDVGGTSVKIGLFEEDGRLLKKWEVKTRKEENGRHILPDVAASIRKVLEEDFAGKFNSGQNDHDEKTQ